MCSWESFTVVTPSGGQQKLEMHSLIDTEHSPVLRHFSMEAGTVAVVGNVVSFGCCNTQVSQVPFFYITCREASQLDLGSVVSLQ
jgi:hypothetical protein